MKIKNCRILISRMRCNFLAKFKKILYMGYRATLNFRKFKVALNPMYNLSEGGGGGAIFSEITQLIFFPQNVELKIFFFQKNED